MEKRSCIIRCVPSGRHTEALKHVALDALGRWIPLFHVNNMAPPDESACAFVDLWTTLGCLPEYAPLLSEAATMAAAELAAAASRAAVEAAEMRDGGRRMRKRRERKGEVVANIRLDALMALCACGSLQTQYPLLRFEKRSLVEYLLHTSLRTEVELWMYTPLANLQYAAILITTVPCSDCRC